MELILNEQDLTLKPLKKIREGWNEAFQQMHGNGDDQLLIDDVFADETFEE
jgi:antitoxin MazE